MGGCYGASDTMLRRGEENGEGDARDFGMAFGDVWGERGREGSDDVEGLIGWLFFFC